jgi:hypothetical protein
VDGVRDKTCMDCGAYTAGFKQRFTSWPRKHA